MVALLQKHGTCDEYFLGKNNWHRGCRRLMHKKKGVIFQIGEELKVYSDIAIVKNKFTLFAQCKKCIIF
jgi:hypothetical protein